MMEKSFAVLVVGPTSSIRPVNFIGLPDDKLGRQPMKNANLLVIQSDEDEGGVYLLRFSGNEDAGDTWHESFSDAVNQAKYEYSIDPNSWIEVLWGTNNPIKSIEKIYDMLGAG